jgi:ribosomal protein S4E
MKKVIVAFIIAIAFMLTSCSLFQKDSFQGKWQLKLTGGIEETFDFVVSEDNSFSVNKSISYGSREYDVEINGKIEKDGKIKTAIIASGQDMGEFEGIFNYETGKGKWNASILYGEWSAAKK